MTQRQIEWHVRLLYSRSRNMWLPGDVESEVHLALRDAVGQGLVERGRGTGYGYESRCQFRVPGGVLCLCLCSIYFVKAVCLAPSSNQIEPCTYFTQPGVIRSNLGNFMDTGNAVNSETVPSGNFYVVVVQLVQ